MIYDFEIAGLLLRVESDFDLPQQCEMEAFAVKPDLGRQPDMVYTLTLLPASWNVRGEQVYGDSSTAVYRSGSEFHRYFYWSVGSKSRYVLSVIGADRRKVSLYLQQQTLELLLPRLRLSAFLSLETLLLRQDAFLLHASAIDWQGRGILFTAPSGTGKSTQAELWRIHENARIINGDRGLVRLTEDGWKVYGSPYAGSSGIHTNLSAPVACIVVLSQGPENCLKRLSPLAAFQHLYRGTTIPAWDMEAVEAGTELLLKVLETVAVFHLSCRPDQGAVEVLKQALQWDH